MVANIARKVARFHRDFFPRASIFEMCICLFKHFFMFKICINLHSHIKRTYAEKYNRSVNSRKPYI